MAQFLKLTHLSEAYSWALQAGHVRECSEREASAPSPACCTFGSPIFAMREATDCQAFLGVGASCLVTLYALVLTLIFSTPMLLIAEALMCISWMSGSDSLAALAQDLGDTGFAFGEYLLRAFCAIFATITAHAALTRVQPGDLT